MAEPIRRGLPYRSILPTIDPTAFVAETASVIGDVVIGADSGIWFGCVLRGDVNVIRIGDRTNIQDGTVIHCNYDGQGAHIGSGITVGHMALLHDCTLEDDSFVGMRACVMDGAVVESGAMVAAGALVTPGKRVKSGELWAGSPARPMRALSAEERARFKWSADHYAALAREYREG
ncbi:MAG: gamma carbonic anhydrase family protein [Pseudomonadota bacterium]